MGNAILETFLCVAFISHGIFYSKTLLANTSLERMEKNGKKRIKVPLQNGKRVTVQSTHCTFLCTYLSVHFVVPPLYCLAKSISSKTVCETQGNSTRQKHSWENKQRVQLTSTSSELYVKFKAIGHRQNSVQGPSNWHNDRITRTAVWSDACLTSRLCCLVETQKLWNNGHAPHNCTSLLSSPATRVIHQWKLWILTHWNRPQRMCWNWPSWGNKESRIVASEFKNFRKKLTLLSAANFFKMAALFGLKNFLLVCDAQTVHVDMIAHKPGDNLALTCARMKSNSRRKVWRKHTHEQTCN